MRNEDPNNDEIPAPHNAPAQVPADTRQVIIQHEAHYSSGPLPSPIVLAQYNNIIPNAAERIFAMVEKQSAHREALESRLVSGNLRRETIGMVFAFILSMTIIVGGLLLVLNGKDLAGFGSILISVAGLAGIFIYTKHEQHKERADKAASLDSRVGD